MSMVIFQISIYRWQGQADAAILTSKQSHSGIEKVKCLDNTLVVEDIKNKGALINFVYTIIFRPKPKLNQELLQKYKKHLY